MAVPSRLEVSTLRPSGEKLTEVTSCVWPGSERISLPVVRVPQLGRVVLAAGEDARAVGREGDRRDGGGVAAEREQFLLAGRARPRSGRVVLAAGDHALAVGRELAAEHGPFVAFERRQRGCRWPGPKWGRLVAADGEHARAIGRERGGERRGPCGRGRRCSVGLPVSTSHSRAVPSSLAVSSSRPSGENSTELM